LHDTYFLIFIISAYVVVAAFGAWLVTSSERRGYFRARLLSILSRLVQAFHARRDRFSRAATYALSGIAASGTSVRRTIAANRRAAAFVLSLLLIPALGAQLLSQHASLEAYEDIPQPVDPVIASLLQGERLVPPAPLPPELFITRELEAERKEIATASREWNVLDPDFRQRLLAVFQMMANHGYQMILLEGYRSPERQAALAKLGPHITNAGAFQSYHQFGLAADSAFYRDGRIVISERDPWAMEGYRLYGQYAESAGLVWGGRWKMMDFGHVELRKPQILARR